MKSEPLYTVLAIYPTSDDRPEKAYESIRGSNGAGAAYAAQGKRLGSGSRYTDLRLDGESILALSATSSSLENIVKRLETSDSPAVFVIREDLVEGRIGRVQSSKRDPLLLFRLKENEQILRETRHHLLEPVRRGATVAAPSEWR